MLLLTHQQCEAFLLFNWESVELLCVVHDGVVLPVHVEDQDDVVLLGPVGQQPQHGHTGITGPFLSTTTKVRFSFFYWVEFCLIYLWKTLLRKTLNPSDSTQVPSFLTIQSSISRNLSCSSDEHKVTIVLTRSSKSFTCWKKRYHSLFRVENKEFLDSTKLLCFENKKVEHFLVNIHD